MENKSILTEKLCAETKMFIKSILFQEKLKSIQWIIFYWNQNREWIEKVKKGMTQSFINFMVKVQLIT